MPIILTSANTEGNPIFACSKGTSITDTPEVMLSCSILITTLSPKFNRPVN